MHSTTSGVGSRAAGLGRVIIITIMYVLLVVGWMDGDATSSRWEDRNVWEVMNRHNRDYTERKMDKNVFSITFKKLLTGWWGRWGQCYKIKETSVLTKCS